MSDFWIGVTSSVAATIIQWLTKTVWNWASLKADAKFAKRITRNRGNLTIAIIALTVLAFAVAIATFGDGLSQTGTAYLSVVCIGAVGWHLVSELRAFWRVGFNYISQTVSSTTYRDALKESYSEFYMLGTNAFNLVRLDEFGSMVKRIRENGGSLKLVLAHPDSTGLREAARCRGKREDIYKDQAVFSLGLIMNLVKEIGYKIDIRLYDARSIEELPIFRIMLTNMTQAIASVAVYGRDDHGSSMPQFYAYRMKNPDKAYRSMFGILCRYFGYFYDKSYPLTASDIDRFIKYWMRCRNNVQLLSRLEG